ncbi:MAG: EAL domain-containing protein [Gammaproteobacteria bacterium]|jgi:PleD family two-component response regulator/EAL domain-containing protein (putative c-di-GMP-specific phosphodiesterase class I)|nr:EAL domain-containing protein [Gammaproteobacteria bacterium]
MPDSPNPASTRDSFVRQLSDRIFALQENWKVLAQGKWEHSGLASLYDRLRELSELCRRYDVPQVSESLASLEAYFSSFVGSHDRPSLGQIVEIDGLLRALRAAAGAARAGLPAEAADSITVYLLAKDATSLGGIAGALRDIGCETMTFNNTPDLVRAVSDSSPQAIVADTSLLPTMPPLSAELIRLATHHEIRIPLVFLSSSNALALRVEAMRAGGTAYFVRPFDERAVAAQIREVARPRREDPFRVLIVDDDRYQADFAATILRKAGMETSIVNEPLRVMESLHEFDPELILMDIYMPEVDGIELTSVIREDNDFVAVPIVFLSGEQNPEKQLNALSVGGDDFITKPINPRHLVTIVTNRIRRLRATQRAEKPQQIVEAERQGRMTKERPFLDRVAKALEAEAPADEVQALLCVEVDQPEALREQVGIGGIDALVAQLGNVVLGELGAQDIAAKLGDIRLGVFARRPSADEVAALAEQIRARVAGHGFDVEAGVGRVTVSIGVCVADGSVEDPNGLVTRAGAACAGAHDAGGNAVVHYRQDDKTAAQRLADAELVNRLRQALGSDGFDVQFQPLLDVGGGAKDHYELTLRLLTPQGDPVDQDALRVVAGRAVLLDRLDRLAVEKGLGVIGERRRQGHETHLFVSQSALTATDQNFATWLSGRLRARQLVGTGLVLQFRLPELSDQLSSVRTVLAALKEMGVAIALSRFPDKPVALRVLQFLQADYVRLADTVAAADTPAVSAIVRQVHEAGAKVIVDGVDDPRGLDKHWSAGVDLLQGSFIQRPSGSMDFRFEQAVM